MLDTRLASSIAQQFIAKARSGGLVLLEGKTIERGFGWVFFYENKRFVETGEIGARLIGNSPLIVSRQDGKIYVTRTAHPVEFYIRMFEKAGELATSPTTWRRVFSARERASASRIRNRSMS
jgi:hypothetical protein